MFFFIISFINHARPDDAIDRRKLGNYKKCSIPGLI